MLTKNQVKFRIRSGRVYPVYLDPKSDKDAAVIEAALATVAKLEGRSEGECSASFNELERQNPAMKALSGVLQVLMDASACADEGVDLEAKRWQVLELSERERQGAHASVAAYRAAVGVGDELLYGDLPQFRSCTWSSVDLSVDHICRLYNLELVRGLLLSARELCLSFSEEGLPAIRSVVRAMRFHRLVMSVEGAEGQHVYKVSGPLSIHNNQSLYGMRLANFFPNLLGLEGWKVSAQLHLRKKEVNLELDSEAPLVASGPARGHVPDELSTALGRFNEKGGWQASESHEVVNLGGSQYGVPDIVFTEPDKRKCYLELFHPWHRSTLSKRLELLPKDMISNYFVGIDKKLTKQAGIADKLSAARGKGVKIIEFNGFPSARALGGLFSPS